MIQSRICLKCGIAITSMKVEVLKNGWVKVSVYCHNATEETIERAACMAPRVYFTGGLVAVGGHA